MPEKSNAPDIFLELHVIPGASSDEFCGWHDNRLKLRIKAPPVNGKANDYLIKYLSKKLALPAKDIVLVRGNNSRQKTVKIVGANKKTEITLQQLQNK